jgi:hypothetical protein
MSKVISRIIVFITFIPIISALSCFRDIPIGDLSLLKAKISRAEEVRADKYAPLELKISRESIYKCHEDIKLGKIEEARAGAIRASKFADEAIVKSLPLLSRDGIEEAKRALRDAIAADAELYANKQFTDAAAKIIMAEKLHGGKNYWDSYLVSGQSARASIKAKDLAINSVPEASRVEAQLIKLRMDYEALLKNRGPEFASDYKSVIRTKLGDAEKDFRAGLIRDCYYKILSAKADLDEANTCVQKGIAAEKRTIADIVMNEISTRGDKDEFINDIKRTEVLISEGKHLFGLEYYEEAGKKFARAIEDLNNILVNLKNLPEFYKKKSEDKINEAESFLKNIKDDKRLAMFKDRIEKSAALVEESRKLNKNKSYKESLSSSEMAIQSLNSISAELHKSGK